MTPQQLKANVERFNEASGAATAALGAIRQFADTHELPDELVRHLEAYSGAVTVMLETSSELIEPALLAAQK